MSSKLYFSELLKSKLETNALINKPPSGPSKPVNMPLSTNSLVGQLGPDGFWDRTSTGKRGPLEPLEKDQNKKSKLEKNIITNQIQFVQYINSSVVVVPIRLPSNDQNTTCWIDLNKSLVSGDVVFALRCNTVMCAARFASKVTRKMQYNHGWLINLATLNFIIYQFQDIFNSFLQDWLEFALNDEQDNPNDRKSTYFDALRTTASNLNIKTRQWMQWFDYLADGSQNGSFTFSKLLFEAFTTQDTSDYDSFIQKNLNEYLNFFVETGQSETDVSKTGIVTMALHVWRKNLSNLVFDWIAANSSIYGVFIGSDKQGGSHQESNNSYATWPNDYVGTIQVTGKSRKVNNMWNYNTTGFSAGTSLGFSLRPYNDKITTASFRLSSNPLTAYTVHVSPKLAAYVIGEDTFDTTFSTYSLLVPNVKEYRSGNSQGTCSSFFEFAYANQSSKPMNRQNDPCAIAVDAERCAKSPIIEVVMKKIVHRNNDHDEFMHNMHFDKLNYSYGNNSDDSPSTVGEGELDVEENTLRQFDLNASASELTGTEGQNPDKKRKSKKSREKQLAALKEELGFDGPQQADQE